ncbi:MAG: LuxR C-terminal-related transcriptional regulator [Cyclobacterium sp.]|uniref:response regulator transcription factor n=1 Tax=unclassified Cyclobacterium TaxID=2615055 RepID=UPI0013D4F250|nr:LuxR C-terminal-related transcriptional regulator [Cyclobacterium sp. SYSU L10401]
MEILPSLLNQQQQQLNHFKQMIIDKDNSMEEVGEMSREIMQYCNKDFRCLFLNRRGRNWLGLDAAGMETLKKKNPEELYHPDTVDFEFPRIKMYFRNECSSKVYSNYQQFYHPGEKNYAICLVMTKKLFEGYLSFILPLEKKVFLSTKIKRIIAEELFKRDHEAQFSTLTERELEVFRRLAMGENNPKIAECLFISRRTVEQHRKKINQKLDIHSPNELLTYAYAFDVIG